jgi:trehalose 6-phosphate synthase
MTTERQILVASNRGPVSFTRDPKGRLVAKRGSGGLVTALTAAMDRAGGLWVAAAMSPEDREAAERGPISLDGASYRVRYLDLPQRTFDAYYHGIANRVLWFLHHFLWDIPRAPVFDDLFRREWAAYRRVNRAFAQALAEEGDASALFLVQDYHLSLVPGYLRELRPDARIAHFSHIPFAGPGYVRILPGDVREELYRGLLGADIVGFQDPDWADNFLFAAQHVPGLHTDHEARTIVQDGRVSRVGVYPISIDPEAMRAQASAHEVGVARRKLERWRGDAKLIVRVDRTEPSKNILRGFQAYESFLRRNPRWRGRIRFLALLNSSRGEIREYREYLKECLRAAGRINERFGEGRWQPVRVIVGDHFPTVLAAYQMYDVLLVNPIFDGMNLVAKEGGLLNQRDGVLVLSENAGACRELTPHALRLNPFDVAATADALQVALSMSPSDRARHAAGLVSAVESRTAADWVAQQVRDLEEGGPAALSTVRGARAHAPRRRGRSSPPGKPTREELQGIA